MILIRNVLYNNTFTVNNCPAPSQSLLDRIGVCIKMYPFSYNIQQRSERIKDWLLKFQQNEVFIPTCFILSSKRVITMTLILQIEQMWTCIYTWKYLCTAIVAVFRILSTADVKAVFGRRCRNCRRWSCEWIFLGWKGYFLKR